MAPFSLLTYEDAAKRAKLIAAVTAARVMPPWKPEPGHGAFLNERRLTDSEIALFARGRSRRPEGDPKTAGPTHVPARLADRGAGPDSEHVGDVHGRGRRSRPVPLLRAAAQSVERRERERLRVPAW